MVSRIGRATALAFAAGTAVAGAAEVNRLVKAQVTVAGNVQRFLHEVALTNRSEARRVTSVLLWQHVWLPLEPKNLTAPEGWTVRTLHRDGPGGVGWAVQFECVPKVSAGRAGLGAPADDEEAPCGIGAGETVKFRVMLDYLADTIRVQPILVGFSDGRLAIAS